VIGFLVRPDRAKSGARSRSKELVISRLGSWREHSLEPECCCSMGAPVGGASAGVFLAAAPQLLFCCAFPVHLWLRLG
jgi:hypothetical protein